MPAIETREAMTVGGSREERNAEGARQGPIPQPRQRPTAELKEEAIMEV